MYKKLLCLSVLVMCQTQGMLQKKKIPFSFLKKTHLFVNNMGKVGLNYFASKNKKTMSKSAFIYKQMERIEKGRDFFFNYTCAFSEEPIQLSRLRNGQKNLLRKISCYDEENNKLGCTKISDLDFELFTTKEFKRKTKPCISACCKKQPEENNLVKPLSVIAKNRNKLYKKIASGHAEDFSITSYGQSGPLDQLKHMYLTILCDYCVCWNKDSFDDYPTVDIRFESFKPKEVAKVLAGCNNCKNRP